MEEWITVRDAQNYEVSDAGRVRRKKTSRVLSQWHNKDGYSVTNMGTNRGHLVHVLVLNAFLGPAPNGHECNHVNGLKDDNRICNLEWATKRQNQQHAVSVLGHRVGSKNPSHKLTEQDVLDIRRRVAAGETQRSLASEYGVGAPSICVIVSRKVWTHI